MGQETARDEVKAGFLRQRRNLLLLSQIAIFGVWSGIVIPEDISLFGTAIHMLRPEVVIYAFWIVFIWTFWRYFQYFNDLGSKGFGDLFKRRADNAARYHAMKMLNKDDGLICQAVGKAKKPGINITVVHKAALRMLNKRQYIEVTGNLVTIDADGEKEYTDFSVFEVPIEPHEYWMLEAKSKVAACIYSHNASEYIAPILLAVVALIVGGLAYVI